MDLARVSLILCVFLLAVCLVFAVSALTVLRNAVSEAERVRVEAQDLLEDFGDRIDQIKEPESTKEPDESTVPVDILCDSFCMRESEGKIAIYTSDGYLVRQLDIAVDTLPEADRNALRDGICVSSWKELLALIQDYTG